MHRCIACVPGTQNSHCQIEATSSPPPGSHPQQPLSITSIPLLQPSVSAGSALTLPSPTTSPLASWVPPSITSPSAQAGPSTPPFHLASSVPPIPAKLVRKIQALEFVEMRDLLPDNIALAERLEALPSHRSPAKAPETREAGLWQPRLLHSPPTSPLWRRLTQTGSGTCWLTGAGGTEIRGHWVDHLRSGVPPQQDRPRRTIGPT